jgi:hypothetical protein
MTYYYLQHVMWIMHLGLVDRPFMPLIRIVPSFISRGTPHHAAREISISEGRKLNIRILPAARNELQLLGSFTCPKVGTWGRLFYFPSEWRHAEDFYIRKIRRPGLNPRTWEPEASMLTSRPPKPLTSCGYRPKYLHNTGLTFWHRNLTFKFLAHPVCKMWITQEPKNLALQNTQHFEEKRWRHCTVFKKNLVFIFVE